MEEKTLIYFSDQPVNIEFHDLCYSIPQGKNDEKRILKCISGQFKAGQLHAIMGPSGAGKSTLLNVLATYKVSGTTGNILVNGESRNIRNFRKMSRYIMQQDVLQPLLNVREIMSVAADLKLPKDTRKKAKDSMIDEILEMLRLKKSEFTVTDRLSGGEKKRLSIALELLNNPPVLFLDEPTTGLDDLSSTQCIRLLKQLAEGGRTVICSLHTPSYTTFSMFDNVYVLADGYCVYQGFGPDIVPFFLNIGMPCPMHYNPADYMIEVCSGDYGDYTDMLVAEADNGRSLSYYKHRNEIVENHDLFVKLETSKFSDKPYKETTERHENYRNASWLMQVKIILFRMWLQMYRDKYYLFLRFFLTAVIALIVGSFYLGMGQDGSKTIFNFGFYYITIIKFLYIPMMPVLLSFPTEIQMVKREFFNKWYRLSSYFIAQTISTLPITFISGLIYVGVVYVMTDQPMEIMRFLRFYMICMVTALVSESMGLMVSSSLSLVNSVFLGPVVAVPLMLLAVYGLGYPNIPLLLRIAMRLSFLRYSIEGLTAAMTSDRALLPCPDTEDFCLFLDLKAFAKFMGFGDARYWLDIVVLIGCFFVCRGLTFYLLKQRLQPNKAFRALHFVIGSIKRHFGIS